MTDRRAASDAQAGMPAWARSVGRELEAYGRETALHAPDDFADRVMAAIDAGSPARSRLGLPTWPMFGGSRLRAASVLLVAMLALTAGAALAAIGASAIIDQVRVPPTFEPADHLPVTITSPTATPTERPDQPAAEPNETEKPAERTEPNVGADPDESEATEDAAETDEPEATDDAAETDEPEATDDAT